MSVVVFDCESTGAPDRTYGRGYPGKGFERIHCTVLCAVVCSLSEEDPSAQLEDPSHVISRSERIVCWCDIVNRGNSSGFEAAFEAFDAADVIVAYNGLDFDMPLLWKHYPRTKEGDARYRSHTMKMHDPFSKRRSVTNCWPKLDDLLRLNGLEPKTGTGAQAVHMWNRRQRHDLEHYCMHDTVQLAMLVLSNESHVRMIDTTAKLMSNADPPLIHVPVNLVNVRDALASLRCSQNRLHWKQSVYKIEDFSRESQEEFEGDSGGSPLRSRPVSEINTPVNSLLNSPVGSPRF